MLTVEMDPLYRNNNMIRNLSVDVICSARRTVFLERSSRKIVSFEEQIVSKRKYLMDYNEGYMSLDTICSSKLLEEQISCSIFFQMEAVVDIFLSQMER